MPAEIKWSLYLENIFTQDILFPQGKLNLATMLLKAWDGPPFLEPFKIIHIQAFLWLLQKRKSRSIKTQITLT